MSALFPGKRSAAIYGVRDYLRAWYFGLAIGLGVGLFGPVGAFLRPLDTFWTRAGTRMGEATFWVDAVAWLMVFGVAGLLFQTAVDLRDRGYLPRVFAIFDWVLRARFWCFAALFVSVGITGGYLSWRAGENVSAEMLFGSEQFRMFALALVVSSLVIFALKEKLFGRRRPPVTPQIDLAGFFIGGACFLFAAYFAGILNVTAWDVVTAAVIGAVLSSWIFGGERERLDDDRVLDSKRRSFSDFRVSAGGAARFLTTAESRVRLVVSALFDYFGGAALMAGAYWIVRSFDTVLSTYHGPLLNYVSSIPANVAFWTVCGALVFVWAVSLLWAGTISILEAISAEAQPVATSEDPGRARKATRRDAAGRGFLEV